MDDITIDINSNSTISDLLKAWSNIQKIKKEILDNEDKIKTKLRIFMKEKNWTKYDEPTTKFTINIIEGHTETFDKKQLQFLLSNKDYAKVIKITRYEKMLIMSPSDKERINNIIKSK